MTPTEYETYVRAHEEALAAWNAVAGDRQRDNVALRTMLARALRDPLPYSDAQIAAWEELQRRFEPLRPVAECLEAYKRVITSSLRLGAISSLPVGNVSPGALPIPLPADTTDETQLLRITCEQLQRLPVPSTLAATLDVAGSSEAAALRSQLAHWATELRNGNIDATTTVADDVAYARSQLNTARSMSHVGVLMTYVSVPLAVASALVASPVLVPAGIVVATVGSVAVTSQKVLERLNRWAMYNAR